MPLQLHEYHEEFAQLTNRNTSKNRVEDGVRENTYARRNPAAPWKLTALLPHYRRNLTL